MDGIRCFDLFKNNLTASDLCNARKKKIIYHELQQNINRLGTANPIKKNGETYNKNTIVNSSCDISGGYVDYAESYLIKNEVSEGAALCNPTTVHDNTIALVSNCSNACINTFNSGFQDTGEITDSQNIVHVNNISLAVVDTAAEVSLHNLDINANKDSEFFDFTGPFAITAGSLRGETQMGTGASRYRNATVMGEVDISVHTNPIIVFQFSQDGNNWFSDGIPATLFDPNPSSTIRQFCLQRNNVPTLWVGVYYVTPTTLNRLQLLLTKS